jgi:CheY-like chemotaxis protein
MTAETQGIEILLVEDNPRDAEMAIRTFRRQGLASRVVHVSDGREALDLLAAEACSPSPPPQLVLLDLKLPKVDGLEVLRAIRGDLRTRLIPVVMMTSSQEPQDLEQSHQLGANGYVVKPVDFEQFAAMLELVGRYWIRLNRAPTWPASPPDRP